MFKNYNKKIISFIILFLLCFSSTAFLVKGSIQENKNNQVVNTVTDWWNDNWLFRKQLVISDNKLDLDNYQLLITLPSANYLDKTDNFLDDLRFTDYNNNSLSYWFEEWNPLGTSRVWVKVPEIKAFQNISIFMYYGNNESISESNGFSTFIAFEDFDSNFNAGDNLNDTNGWSVEFGNPIIDDTPSGRQSLGLKFEQLTSELFAHGAHFNWSDTLQNISISYYWHLDNFNIRNGYHHYFSNETQMTSTRLVNGLCDWWDGFNYYDFSPSASYSINSWYRFEQIATKNDYFLKINDSEHLGGLTHPNDGLNGFSWRSQSERTYTFFIDDVYVRQYVSDEPSIIFLEEESIQETPTLTPTMPTDSMTFTIGANFLLVTFGSIILLCVLRIMKKRK